VRGIVQGVGFRPTVWQLARAHDVRGHVANDGAGVIIEAWADRAALDAFVQALIDNPPPLARIEKVEREPIADTVPAELPATFEIIHSIDGAVRTQVSPDVATCEACLQEIRDPAQRRYRYPFTNCTHCGPRLTIIEAMPYDRANTSMRVFPMCDACRAEYENPADRRFHAQPVACPQCGPRVWLTDASGRELARADAALQEAVRLLRAGSILAIRGVGGFHLVCDATRGEVVAELRRRKHRPGKPLALMARDVDVIRRYRQVSAQQEELLRSPAAPIVLLERPAAEALPEAIAPGIGALGFMLPMSPLHHLLLEPFDTPLVFTSANRSGQPQCIANDEALEQLADIADAFLLHDREIVSRVDDSVIRFIDDAPVFLRRSRGYAPAPVALHEDFREAPPLLALGGELKNTFCLLRDGAAVLSHHIGDLEEARTWQDYEQALRRYLDLYDLAPAVLAIDLHPAYRSSELGRQWAARDGLPLVEVQHHHAHLASVMAEHGMGPRHEAIAGIILDGIGHGEDGSGWGCEILLGDFLGFRRLARLRPAHLPGGEQAMRQPWRNLAARLLMDERLARWLQDDAAAARVPALRRLRERPLSTLQAMMQRGVNAPLASSAGRLFDAVAELLDVAPETMHFEGEAAMRLEHLALSCPAREHGRITLSLAVLPASGDTDALLELDPATLLDDMLSALVQQKVSRAALAHAFHVALAEALAAALRQGLERQCSGSGAECEASTDTVALSGGVMQNRLLCELLSRRLRDDGFTVLMQRQVSPGDGGLALGQAAIAAARAIHDGLPATG